MPNRFSVRYFPAVVRAEFDSPLDALRSLCVPHAEAMDLVVASWQTVGKEDADSAYAGESIVTTIDGGRRVAILPLAGGRWAACYVYLGQATASRAEAERRLRKLVRGKKRGLVGVAEAMHL